MTITANLNADELLVAGDGLVLVSPEATPFPDDIADVVDLSLDAAWTDLGYATEAGPRATFGRNVKDIMGWQSFYSLRSIVTDVPTQIEVDLRQWNSDTLGVALGGVVVTDTATGTMLEPEDPSFLDIRQLIVYAIDGDKHYAFCFRRVQNTKALAFPFDRQDESALPIGFKVLGAEPSKAWFMLTDDPAVLATGS